MITGLFTSYILVPLFFLLLMSLVAKNVIRRLFSWQGILVMAALFYMGALTGPNISGSISYLSRIFYKAAQTAMAPVPKP